MAIQHEHGKWGEDLAASYLAEHGISVLRRNWRYRRAEIDIIGMDQGILVFIEVKVRHDAGFGRPELKVDQRKQRLLIEAGMTYMRSIGHEGEIRFDIISILGTPSGTHNLTHFKDAFFPGLNYMG